MDFLVGFFFHVDDRNWGDSKGRGDIRVVPPPPFKFQNIGERQKQKKKKEKRERQLYKLYACTGIYIFFIIMPTFLPQIPTQNLWKIPGYVTGKHYFFVSFKYIKRVGTLNVAHLFQWKPCTTRVYVSIIFTEGLQAIQLEDGTTAYITHPSAESLFGDAQITNLDSSTLSLDQLAAQVRTHLN